MILVYHHIARHKSNDENTVSVDTFRQHIQYLIENKYVVVNMLDYDPDDKKQIVLTFDDGYKDVLNALPILKRYNLPFHVFVIGDWIGKDWAINETDIAKIIKSGGFIEWHTKTHPDLMQCNAKQQIQEMQVPNELKQLAPNHFNCVAYPYWKHNQDVIECAKKYFKMARSGNGNGIKNNKFAMEAQKMTESTTFDDKIVKYVEMAVPTWPCNFRCQYCYVGQHCTDAERARVQKFEYTPEQMANALSKKRLGGTAIMNFCANGETLILPQNVEYIKAILGAGHFVMVVTNMTQTKALKDLCELPDEWRERLFLKCSFHWMELKRLGLLEQFADNVNMCWNAGISFTVEITPHDELVPEIDEIKRFSMERFGALPHITVARDENNQFERLTKYSVDKYNKIWEQFDSDLFQFKSQMWGKKIHDFCYVGDWGYSVNIADGNIFRCSSCGHIGNVFQDKKLPHKPACNKCPFLHCYNAHGWIGLGGMVPNVESPTYAQMRDRVRTDGTHWIHPRMRHVFEGKISDNNLKYSRIKKFLAKLLR